MNKKMGGRFFVIPEGVPDILIGLSPNAERIYSTMRWFFNIREDWESDKEWCVGTVCKGTKEAKKADIIRELQGVSRATFYLGAWKELLKSGLVKEEEGKIIITKYKKKLDSSKPKESESDFAEDNGVKPESNDRLDKIEGTLEQLTKNMALLAEVVTKGITVPVVEAPPVEKESQEIDLISLFYSKIGQNKIASEKRKKGEIGLVKLHEDGFTDEQIAFAIDWTVKSATQKIYDFNVIPHTIGDAMIDWERNQKRESREKEQGKKRSQKDAEYEEGVKNRDRLKEIKADMDDSEIKELRARAKELAIEKGMSISFMTDPIYEGLEIEILKGDGKFEI